MSDKPCFDPENLKKTAAAIPKTDVNATPGYAEGLMPPDYTKAGTPGSDVAKGK
jgi:hypothetical protein